ncbi:hypothetical protein [Kitasatospora mediocidica]|uniref:hypothetical protein n=1 Tax=Kitasatospora mediocidica TaxID=58352 RepID=UPI0012FC1098|nr:hypothetical protein [Kitasatospora mediocidica]
MNATIEHAPVSAAELKVELAVFEAFCDRCGRNPQTWSTQTRRQYRKRIAKCRKCDRRGGAA